MQMPERLVNGLISATTSILKISPYALAFGIGWMMALKAIVTILSIVLGRLLVHYVNPLIIKKIDSWKKKQ